MEKQNLVWQLASVFSHELNPDHLTIGRTIT